MIFQKTSCSNSKFSFAIAAEVVITFVTVFEGAQEGSDQY